MRTLLLIFIALSSLLQAYCQNIKIGLFNKYRVQSMTFSVVEGTYHISDDHHIVDTLKPSNICFIELHENYISIKTLRGKQYTSTSFNLIGISETNIYQLKSINPALSSRSYDNNLFLSIAFGRLQITNELDLDKYIAGVVEAEAGAYAEKEFYKAQALLCRTYAMKNIAKHGGEDFNLCDDVHCQAFNGRNRYNPKILEATIETHNLIIVDKDSNFITAVFHANSGGETCTADHVWTNAPPYLQRVSDPYSLNGKGAQWQKEIPLDEWKDFLIDNGFNVKHKKAAYFKVSQDHRKKFYILGNDKITYSKIRSHFKLRSAFFSIAQKDSHTLLLTGKGYGHGIGMSQEGAMEMARQGFSHRDIINFYFKDVSVIKY